MGLAICVAAGMTAFGAARLVPAGRIPGWFAELLLALGAALAFGAIATALDFGGWRVAEWRAGLLSTLGAFAAIGSLRIIRLLRTG